MATVQAAGPQARGCIQLYGWDSRTETWTGPTGLSGPLHASRRLLQALQATPGRSWYGPGGVGEEWQPLDFSVRDMAGEE